MMRGYAQCDQISRHMWAHARCAARHPEWPCAAIVADQPDQSLRSIKITATAPPKYSSSLKPRVCQDTGLLRATKYIPAKPARRLAGAPTARLAPSAGSARADCARGIGTATRRTSVATIAGVPKCEPRARIRAGASNQRREVPQSTRHANTSVASMPPWQNARYCYRDVIVGRVCVGSVREDLSYAFASQLAFARLAWLRVGHAKGRARRPTRSGLRCKHKPFRDTIAPVHIATARPHKHGPPDPRQGQAVRAAAKGLLATKGDRFGRR